MEDSPIRICGIGQNTNMDRSYFEYYQIVESFISRQDTRNKHQRFTETNDGAQINDSAGTNNGADSDAVVSGANERERRMKLAFINVLREEMPEPS